VGLEEAEVTFRPGEARRADLVKKREEAAALEKEVKVYVEGGAGLLVSDGITVLS